MGVRTFGYARVSTREQSLSRQLDAFKDWGLEREQIFADKASGRNFDRPQYKRLIRQLRREDVLVIKSIDRLGRNYEEIIEEWRRITKIKGAHVVVLDMPLLDTRVRTDNITGTVIADLVLQLLSYVAQIERESIHQRQAEGIASAKARGIHCGRPRLRQPPTFAETREFYLEKRITRKEASIRLGCSLSTFDRWMREYKEDSTRQKESAKHC